MNSNILVRFLLDYTKMLPLQLESYYVGVIPAELNQNGEILTVIVPFVYDSNMIRFV